MSMKDIKNIGVYLNFLRVSRLIDSIQIIIKSMSD